MRTEASRNMLNISGLRFSYEDRKTGRAEPVIKKGRGKKGLEVVRIDSLSFPSGGCHAVIGANGSGKTTLLKLIAGLLAPDEGRIDGGCGAVLVHQNPYLLSGTVFSNVAYGLKIKKLHHAEIKSRVDSELQRWNLTHLRDRHTSKLSGGEKQRTAIARATVLRPDILLLDEPTASVDPDNINQMEAIVGEIVGSGITVILSTHHIDFAYRVSDTIVKLKRGRQVDLEENIIQGCITGRNESLNIFEAGGTRLNCPGRDGDFKRAVFSMNDVILSRERIASSAGNIFESAIIGLNETPEGVIVQLESGFRYRAMVSATAAQELKLAEGGKVFALLKSSSINLY